MNSSSHDSAAAAGGSSDAVNLARPVRPRRRCSLPRSRDTFILDEGGRLTVADVLGHVLPAAEVNQPTTSAETIMIEDSNDETGPSASPVAPAFSPLTPPATHVDNVDIARAEIGPFCKKRTAEHSPTPKSKKRKASDDVPVTPPPRRLRLKAKRTTTTFKSASDSKVSSAAMISKGSNAASTALSKKPPTAARKESAQASNPQPAATMSFSAVVTQTTEPISPTSQGTNPLIALAHNIEDANAFEAAIIESNSHTLDSDGRLIHNDTDNISVIKRAMYDFLAATNGLFRRQRVLVHNYDTFDVQTYNPGVRVDPGTAALRQFVGILREGLNDLEARIVALYAL